MASFAQVPGVVRDLLLLRRGPQELPHSQTLLGTLALATVGLGAWIELRVLDVPDASLSVLRVALLVGVLLAVVWGILRWQQKSSRFLQTASALLGVGLVFDLVTAAILLLALPLPEKGADLDSMQVLAGALSLVLVAWQLVVTGHVFRHALDVSLQIGVRFALLFTFARIVLALVVAQAVPYPA